MLKICICDDNPAILEDLERIVAEWIHRKGLMAVVKGVGTGGACFNECGDWDIFLLDIGIPDISGIDLARKIRALRHDAIIIFITAYGHFMADAFAVHAFGYISKPFAREQIDTVLDDALVFVDHQPSRRYVRLPFASGSGMVATVDIRYFERNNRKITAVMVDRQEVVKAKIETLEEWLSSEGFVRCHRGTIVNLAHIRRLTSREITMDNGDVLAIAQGRASILQERFFRYAQDKNRLIDEGMV